MAAQAQSYKNQTKYSLILNRVMYVLCSIFIHDEIKSVLGAIMHIVCSPLLLEALPWHA